MPNIKNLKPKKLECGTLGGVWVRVESELGCQWLAL